MVKFFNFVVTTIVLIPAIFCKKKEKHARYSYENPTKGEPIFTCPPLYELVEHGPEPLCVKSEIYDPEPLCSIGRFDGNMCVDYQPLLTQCPPDFHQSGHSYKHDSGSYRGGKKKSKHDEDFPLYNECIRISHAPMEYFCPDGQPALGTTCMSYRQSPVSMVCPVGRGHKDKDHDYECNSHKKSGRKKKHDYDSGCVECAVVPPIFTCRPGFVLQNNLCIGSISVPCPMPPPPPLPATPHKKGGYMLRRLKKKDRGYEYAAPIPHKAPKLCEREITEPAISACPPDAYHHNGSKKSKKRNNSSDLICTVLREIPLQPQCTIPNATIDPTGQFCEAEYNIPAHGSCPPSFTSCDDRKHGKHGSHGYDGYHTEDCCRFESVEPVISCPPDYSSEEGQCLAAFPPEFECPIDSEPFGSKCKIHHTVSPRVQQPLTIMKELRSPRKQQYSHKK